MSYVPLKCTLQLDDAFADSPAFSGRTSQSLRLTSSARPRLWRPRRHNNVHILSHIVTMYSCARHTGRSAAPTQSVWPARGAQIPRLRSSLPWMSRSSCVGRRGVSLLSQPSFTLAVSFSLPLYLAPSPSLSVRVSLCLSPLLFHGRPARAWTSRHGALGRGGRSRPAPARNVRRNPPDDPPHNRACAGEYYGRRVAVARPHQDPFENLLGDFHMKSYRFKINLSGGSLSSSLSGLL